jgi:diketogulonate reductase-like aldo/keto reductase
LDKRAFGSTGRQVAVIGQGTWYIENGSAPRAIAALRRGFDLGMTHVDTAEMYGSGKAEEIVGEAISGRRDELFLVSKVLPSHASRNGVIASCEKSLARLGTDRLDCYLLHWRGRVALEETIAGFEQLRRDGKILSWGVSNFDVSDLEELRNLSGERGPACNQVLYHLDERTIENTVIPWCEEHDVAVVAYSPFGHRSGFPTRRSVKGRVLQEIADAHDVSARAVALAFLVAKPAVFAIPKASDPEHTAENARAGDLRLSVSEMARIREAFPLSPRARALPTL